jgi:hypothetical protein
VLQGTRLVLCEDYDLSRPFCEPLEQTLDPPFPEVLSEVRPMLAPALEVMHRAEQALLVRNLSSVTLRQQSAFG